MSAIKPAPAVRKRSAYACRLPPCPAPHIVFFRNFALCTRSRVPARCRGAKLLVVLFCLTKCGGQPPLCEKKKTGGANVRVVGMGYRGLL